MNEQDKKAAEYLAAQGVTFSARLLGETDRDGWTCDEWRVTFEKRAQSGAKAGEFKTAFYTGTGHRKSAKPMPKIVAVNPRCIAAEQWRAQNVKPVAPTAGSVLYSLLLDASGADENFYDWCDSFGYDTDSRKALGIYEACCIIRADVNKFFNAAERAELAAILEDY